MKKRLIRISIVVIAAAVLVIAYQTIVHHLEKRDIRRALFFEFEPVKLSNCTMKRFGAPNDGGYLMCENLMDGVQSAYSYGIAGRDEWGCDVSEKYHLPVHQYDCFDTRKPVCPGGQFIFHEECIGGTASKTDNKIFDTLTNQIVKNNDDTKTLVVKMDVEGSEWDSLLMTSDKVLDRINQLVVEFHQVEDRKYIEVIKKLKKIFLVAHVHVNNWACSSYSSPFPGRVFEVLLVNKRIGTIDATGIKPSLPLALDAPNTLKHKDCQAAW